MPWQGVRLTSLPPCSQRVNRLCDVLLYRCSFRLRTGFSCIYCRLRSMWSLTLCWFWFQFMKNICEVWTFFLKTIAPHDIPHFNLAKFDVNRLARIYRTYIRVLNASYYSAFMIGAEICALYKQTCFAMIFALSRIFLIHATSSMCTASPWDCGIFF